MTYLELAPAITALRSRPDEFELRDNALHLLGGQGEDGTVDAEVTAELQPVEILGRAEDADRQARRVAAGIGRHLAELVDRFDALGLQPVVARDPAVAVAEGALGGVFQPAADDDRWMRLLV